jgi:hypothetical protein
MKFIRLHWLTPAEEEKIKAVRRAFQQSPPAARNREQSVPQLGGCQPRYECVSRLGLRSS